jgi:hypothetical protein
VGKYFLVDGSRNCVEQAHVDPEKFAKELGVVPGGGRSFTGRRWVLCLVGRRMTAKQEFGAATRQRSCDHVVSPLKINMCLLVPECFELVVTRMGSLERIFASDAPTIHLGPPFSQFSIVHSQPPRA